MQSFSIEIYTWKTTGSLLLQYHWQYWIKAVILYLQTGKFGSDS